MHLPVFIKHKIIPTANETLWRWYGLTSWSLDGDVRKVVLPGMSAADCMQACVTYPNFNCSAVLLQYSTSTCHLLEGNRTTKGTSLVAAPDYDYFEKYYQG